MDSSGSRQGTLADACVHGKEPLGMINWAIHLWPAQGCFLEAGPVLIFLLSRTFYMAIVCWLAIMGKLRVRALPPSPPTQFSSWVTAQGSWTCLSVSIQLSSGFSFWPGQASWKRGNCTLRFLHEATQASGDVSKVKFGLGFFYI